MRRAARSPARSMMGPAVALMGTPSSVAMTWASVVLPTPGRAEEEDVVEGLAAAAWRPRWRRGGSRSTWGWPTYSSRARGRRDWSKPASSSPARAETRRGSFIALASGDDLQGAAQEVLEPRRCRRRAAPGRRRARPPRASSRDGRARRGGPPSGWCRPCLFVRLRRRRAGGILSFSSTTRRSAVFLPTRACA